MTDAAAMRTQPVQACILCGSPGRVLHDGLHDRLFGTPGTWSVRKCSGTGCGLLWLDPAPIEQDLWKAYTSYYTHDVADQGTPRSIQAIVARNVVRCLNLLLLPLGLRRRRFLASTVYLAGIRPGRLLEVGCGGGAILERLRRMGWQVQGVDLDPKAVETARVSLGLDVRHGTLDQCGFDAETFDAVVLSHVIEHVHDPVGLVRECWRVLKRGGCLVVVTPNADALGHARFGRNWRGLEPPRHLHIFPAATLGDIARRAGFEIAEVWTTAAHAESIFISSTVLANSEKPGPDTTGDLMMAVRGFLFQARELVAGIRQEDSGEEVVLKAFR